MKITYQEKEKNLVALGTLHPTDVCRIKNAVHMVVQFDSQDNVYLIKLGTGEVVTLNDRTLAEPLEAVLVVTE